MPQLGHSGRNVADVHRVVTRLVGEHRAERRSPSFAPAAPGEVVVEGDAQPTGLVVSRLRGAAPKDMADVVEAAGHPLHLIKEGQVLLGGHWPGHWRHVTSMPSAGDRAGWFSCLELRSRSRPSFCPRWASLQLGAVTTVPSNWVFRVDPVGAHGSLLGHRGPARQATA